MRSGAQMWQITDEISIPVLYRSVPMYYTGCKTTVPAEDSALAHVVLY